MASIKIAYIGGGSTRAPGTMASLIDQGENFAGSEVVLIDLDAERLAVVEKIARGMARARGLDLRTTATTDRRAGLQDCDAVLTSFRPGGFEARHIDESVPLKHGLIGQETQGAGGFFMALRSLAVMQGVVEDMQASCPGARLFNYTNPINIVSEAVCRYTDIPTVSLCEGPITFPQGIARAAGLDPDRMDAVMIGLNHACWSVRNLYDGEDMLPLVREAHERRRAETDGRGDDARLLELAAAMDSLPASYFKYYYYRDEVLAELQAKPTTRAQDILASSPAYWRHYREQAESPEPVLDPALSRGGIHELELALDVMDAVYNDRGEVWPVNVPNRGSISDLPDGLVVEVQGYVDAAGVQPLAHGALPPQVAGLVKMLGEYQYLAARAGWCGTRRDAIQALASNPLVLSVRKAEAVYDEMAGLHREYLPERLLHD